ncbi:SGNH/GDSL hydrolase family protein [Geodermatophilus nigrescens]
MEERPVRLAVVGDSITAGIGAPLEGTQARGTGSWLPAAVGGPVELVGGWAVPGAHTAEMAAGVQPLEADALVVLGGTNDVLADVPWERTREDLLAVVATAGVPRVLLVAVPPSDRAPEATAALNGRLRQLAAEQGWSHLDAWADVTAADGRFVPGASADGIHPVQPVADAAGGRIRAALLDLTGD